MKIPKDTEYFQYKNLNPKNRKTDDCVVRAISEASGLTYEQVLMDLVDIQIKTGYAITDVRCYEKYLQSNGWVKHMQPRKSDNTKYTGKQFLRKFGDLCIANIGGHHCTCIKNGKIIDIWDCSDGCIGNYWTKS